LFTRYIERYIISYLKALFKKTAIK
jgi:hypothetical protein